MAVPRNRLSNARKNSRRAHHAKKPKNTVKCNNCGVSKLPHTICQSCGHYGNGLNYGSSDEE
ncbi:MAG: 50S ribosomal protein L32 [Chlamydiota bacterium]|nr:50S ribosomal protein L32 [Chlamydiota bacterium]